MHVTSNKPSTVYTPVASIIIARAILLFSATTENRSVNWTTVNFTRSGDKKQDKIPTWGVGTPGGGA